MPERAAASRDVARERRRSSTALLWEQVSTAYDDEERRRLREEIVVLNLPVAASIARRYVSRGIPLDDLEQVAGLGLVKAVNGFDPALRKDFVSYAVPTVSGEVKRYFRDYGWTVRPPRRVQELQARINATSGDSTQRSGSAAGPAEIAARLGVERSEVVEALTANGAFTPASLDVPVGVEGSSGTLGDLLATDGDDFEAVENAIVLRHALATLSPRDRLILHRRFHDGLTQQQIGAEIGLSQMQVSRLLARILGVLRALVTPPDQDESLSA